MAILSKSSICVKCYFNVYSKSSSRVTTGGSFAALRMTAFGVCAEYVGNAFFLFLRALYGFRLCRLGWRRSGHEAHPQHGLALCRRRFWPLLLLFSFAARTALVFAAGAASAASAGAAAAAPGTAQGKDRQCQKRCDSQKEQHVPHVHPITPRRISTARTSRVTSQATRHCQTTTAAAHLRPISRRMEATAATQGV